LSIGPNSITASYLGDSNYTSGTGQGTVTVLGAPSITLSPYYATGVVDQPLSMTVTVSGYLSLPSPTGTISLTAGSYTSEPVQLTGAPLNFTIPANSLPVGLDTIAVSYSGDANYLPFIDDDPFISMTAAPAPGLTISGTGVSVNPGATTGNTSTITVTPSGGFTGNVVMTAAITSSPAGAQYLPTLSFGSTNPVVISGANAGSATLTISTTAATSAAFVRPKRPGVPWYAMGGATLACLLLFGIPARRRSWRKMLGMLALLAALSSGVFACGGGGGGGIAGTTAGSYAITVTGTSGSITSTGIVALTVQ
jgi:hypothetical protein